MMYAWSLLIISFSIAVLTASSSNSSLFVSREQADPNRVVTIEFNLEGRRLTEEQYRALQRAIVNALNARRRRSTITQTTAESTTTETLQKQTTETVTAEATTEVKTTAAQETITSVTTEKPTTTVYPLPARKRKRDASWVPTPPNHGKGLVNDDISFVNIVNELDDSVFLLPEILTKGDSKLSLDLLMDFMRDMDRTGELQKAIGSPITLVNLYRGFPKAAKPEIKNSPGDVSRVRKVPGILP